MWPNETLGNQTLIDLHEFCERLMPEAFSLVRRCDQTLRAGVMDIHQASQLCGPVSCCSCNLPVIVTALCVLIRGRRPAWRQATRHEGLKHQQCKAVHVRIRGLGQTIVL